MCKELTIISIFLLALLVDGLWFWQMPLSSPSLFALAGMAIFLLISIFLTGRKYLENRFGLSLRSLLALFWRFARLGFQPGLWKRQTS